MDSAHSEYVHVQVSRLGVDLHLENEVLLGEAGLYEERYHREELRTVLASHDLIVETAATNCCVV